MIARPRARRSKRRAGPLTRALLGCGVVAGPVFVATFLVEGARREDYEPLRHPVSSLALGPGARVQVASFAATGLLYVAEAAGLARARRPDRPRDVPLLIAGVAVGLLGAGAFVTDPVGGYPPGSPALPEPRSTAGALHDLFSAPVFLALPAATFVEAGSAVRHGRRAWAACSTGAGVGMLVTFVLAGVGFAQRPPLVAYAGLLQRVSVATGFAWLSALAARQLNAVSA